MNKILIIAALTLGLAGCNDGPQAPRTPLLVDQAVQQPARFSVTLTQVVSDDLAYGDKRGIYLILDNKTGKEYFGLSGVGITELGSHQSGKTQNADER